MRENKIAIICSSVISLASLAASIILHCCNCDYTSNLFAGIFASGVLTLMIAAINYSVARRRTLESFYSYAQKAVSNYNLFENDGDLERSIDSVLRMNQFDYLALDTAYGDMCFLFHDKANRRYVYEKIYSQTLTLRNLISEKSFHFREYRKAVNGNKPVMRNFIEEIDSAIMERKTIDISNVDVTTSMTSVRNRVVQQLKTELNGKYYELMYGKKRTKEE